MSISEEIKKKFGRVSRFAIISGIPYQQIIDAERFGREWKLDEIRKKIKSCKDRPIEGEITPETRKKIADLWTDYENKNEFSSYWVDSLINGKRRMRETPKVKELIKQLQK